MTIAIVLSGGGALGDFEVGALKFLCKPPINIKPDIICATSVGSINGIKLAEGSGSIDGLESIWLKLQNNTDMYVEEHWLSVLEPKIKALFHISADDVIGHVVKYAVFPPLFLVDFMYAEGDISQIYNAVQEAIKSKSLYSLSPLRQQLNDPNNLDIQKVRSSGIKLRFALVSLESGDLRFVNEAGILLNEFGAQITPTQTTNLIDAVLASASIPAIFSAVKVGTDNYVDGGVRDILPIQAAISAGANQIYAIVASTPTVLPKDSFDNKNLLDIALRAAEDIMPNQTLKSEINPPRGWGDNIFLKIIKPTLNPPVHDTMTIEPGLIRINIDYGYMVAFDTVQGPIQEPVRSRQLSDAITYIRKQIWDLEYVANLKIRNQTDGSISLAPIATDPSVAGAAINALRNLRTKKRQLKALVDERRQYGAAVPDNIAASWDQWEKHNWPALTTTPWDKIGIEPMYPTLVDAEATPSSNAWDRLGAPPGGVLGSGPGVCSWAGGRLDVFAKGTDNALWRKWYQNGWSAWESLGAPPGGQITSDAAAVSWNAKSSMFPTPAILLRIDVFARGTDNALWHKWYQNGWSAWESLGAPPGGMGSGPGVCSWAQGRLDVFAKGTDNALWHRWFENGWSAWESLGGILTSDPAAVSWGSGRIDVFARGTDNALWHRWFENGWSAWESLGGILGSGPGVCSWAGGRLDVFARAPGMLPSGISQFLGNDLWHRWFENGWSAWESLGTGITSDPAAVSWGSGRIDVLAMGTDNLLVHKWYDGYWRQ